MNFIPSSGGPWGFFDPAGSYNPTAEWTEQWFFKGHSYIFQLVGILIFVFIIGSLFVFKKYYRKTAALKWFRISIGVYQIVSYFAIYIMWTLYLAVVLRTEWISGPVGPSQVRGFSELMPLHLCSIHQLLSGFILIFPSRKFFEVVAPSALLLPMLAIITPVNGYWSLDNFFYYNYFILHSLIIFAYIYVYKYGLVGKPYSGLLLKWQFLWLSLFSLVAVVWDFIFQTNQLFVGPQSGDPWNAGGFNVGGWNTNFIDGSYMWPFSWLPMFILGVLMISITHVFLFYLPQSFIYNKVTKTFITVPKGRSAKFRTKQGRAYIAFTFKCVFWPIAKITKYINNYVLDGYVDNELLYNHQKK